MVTVCGIDEAGRGPVIGPLVISGVLIEERNLSKLKKAGVKDSKLLMPKKRELLFKKIISTAKRYKILIIEPKEIDQALSSQNLNLNKLEAMKSAMIINYLKPDKVILDCPSTNIKKYVDYLRIYLKDKKTKIKAEHKADVKFVECGAASILSKVTRDKEIKKIEKKVGQSVGTGYPSNQICQKFLKANWDKYPGIFRKTWVTWQNHKVAKAQKKLGEF